MPYKIRSLQDHRALCLCWRRWKQHISLRKQEICFTPVATAVTFPSRWEHLEMLQDSSLFTPPGLELYTGDRMLAGKFSSSHCLFSCWFSSLLVLWLFSRLHGHQSTRLPGTQQQCLQTGTDVWWSWGIAGWFLDLVATATGLSFLALSPHLDGITHSAPSISLIALWVVSPGLLSAAEEFTDRKVTSLGWQKGQREMVFISSVPGHSPLSSLTSSSAYTLWPGVVVFIILCFNFILGWGWSRLLPRHFLFLHFCSGSEHGTYCYYHHQIPRGKLSGLKILEASIIIL